MCNKHHRLPPKRTPTNVWLGCVYAPQPPAAKQLVCDITSQLCTSQDIATDAEAVDRHPASPDLSIIYRLEEELE